MLNKFLTEKNNFFYYEFSNSKNISFNKLSEIDYLSYKSFIKDFDIIENNSNNKEDFWSNIEAKASTEEGATNLRKDPNFAEKANSSLKECIKDDKIVNSYKAQDVALASAEGAGTGVFGFAGLPFNIVLSTFLYFRAVQSIAMFYGYDVKNNPDELALAGDVLKKALNPTEIDEDSDDVNLNVISKILIVSKAEVVKQTSKKHGPKWLQKAEYLYCLLK